MRLELTLIGLLITAMLFSQKLDVEGDIKVGSSGNPTPDAGTIRWTGLNFEGWNGFKWISLSNFKIASIISDVHGNKYPTVKIGEQEWMAENLRVTKYRNGFDIPNYSSDSEWSTASFGGWCWYSNNSSYDQPYGKLYNWFAAANTLWGLCPTGWHVPSEGEWVTLSTFLGGDGVSGGKMKDLMYWTSPNTKASNESNFSGLPNGGREYDGQFISIGDYGYLWSSTENSANALSIHMSYNHGMFVAGLVDKKSGRAVRCLKD
jgi:uncharacterized protein (TIGR02145 family)